MLAYVIFTDKENAYTCAVDFASPTLLNGTWDNMPSIIERFGDVTFVISLFALTIAFIFTFSTDRQFLKLN